MRCLVQWTTTAPGDWESLTPDAWTRAPVRAVPGGRGRTDADVSPVPDGWVHALNIQGVILEGYDAYAIEALPNEGLRATAWNDRGAPPDHEALVWDFFPLAPDPAYGGAYNTRQTLTIYAAAAAQARYLHAGYRPAQIRDWAAFVRPPETAVRYGVSVTDALHGSHRTARSERGYRDWLEGVPAEEIDRDGRLRDQRAVGRYTPSQHTITFYLSDLPRATGVHAATGGEAALMLGTGPVATIARSIAGSASELPFCFTGGSTDPSASEESDWPAGEYRCQLDVNAAGANLTYGFLTVGGAAGHFARVDAALTADQETWVQSAAAFSGTGLKLAVGYRDPAAAPTSSTDRFECLLACNNSSGSAQGLTLNVNGSNSFADGPWTPKPVSVAMGTFVIPEAATVGTEIEVTGLGFQPKAILTFWNGTESLTTAHTRQSYWRGQGWACSTTDRRCGCISEHDAGIVGGAETYRHRNDGFVCITESTGTGNPMDGGILDLARMTTDGFVGVIDEQFTHDAAISANRDIVVMFVAIGGPGIANAGTFLFAEPLGTLGTQEASTGFEPSIVINQMFGQRAADGNDESGNELYVTGAAVRGRGSVKQWMVATGGQDAANPTITAGYGVSTEFCGFNNFDTMTYRAEFTRMLQTGFRMNVLESNSARIVECLAINGGSWDVGTFNTRTDTNDIVVSGLGFAPKVIIFMSVCRATSTTDTPSAHSIHSVGISQGPSRQMAMGTFDKDNVNPGEASHAVDYENVYVRFASDHSIAGRMKLVSIEPDGFVCQMSDADPDAAMVGYIALGLSSEVAFRSDLRQFKKTKMRSLAT